MDLKDKDNGQLQTLFWEAREERKRIAKLEKDLLNELNRRDHLPELPNFTNYQRQLLTTQNKIDLGHWLERPRTAGEIIEYIEHLLQKGK